MLTDIRELLADAELGRHDALAIAMYMAARFDAPVDERAIACAYVTGTWERIQRAWGAPLDVTVQLEVAMQLRAIVSDPVREMFVRCVKFCTVHCWVGEKPKRRQYLTVHYESNGMWVRGVNCPHRSVVPMALLWSGYEDIARQGPEVGRLVRMIPVGGFSTRQMLGVS